MQHSFLGGWGWVTTLSLTCVSRQRRGEVGLSGEEVHPDPAAVHQDWVEAGKDCLCGHYRVCAFLVALCMRHPHRLGWVNIYRRKMDRYLTVICSSPSDRSVNKTCRLAPRCSFQPWTMNHIPPSETWHVHDAAGFIYQQKVDVKQQYDHSVCVQISSVQNVCTLSDTGASSARIPKRFLLLSPRHPPSTTPSSTPSFTQSTGESCHATHRREKNNAVRRRSPFLFFLNRDTLAEKVPCLHFLSQAPRRDCISVSHSESSFRESMLSRQSSKTKFQQVSSVSTTDTVSSACQTWKFVIKSIVCFKMLFTNTELEKYRKSD